jgi:hypothetical protein
MKNQPGSTLGREMVPLTVILVFEAPMGIVELGT